MTKLEALAQKHARTFGAKSVSLEDFVAAALREWTEECAQVVERTLLVPPWQAQRIAALVRMLAEEEVR